MVAIRTVLILIFIIGVFVSPSNALRPKTIKEDKTGEISENVLIYEREEALRELKAEKARLEARKKSPTLTPHIYEIDKTSEYSPSIRKHSVPQKNVIAKFDVSQNKAVHENVKKSVIHTTASLVFYIFGMIILLVWFIRRYKQQD